MKRFVKSLLAACGVGAAVAGCATYDYGYGYSQPYAYGYDTYTYDYGPYYDYGPGYYVGPPALGFYWYGDSRDHDWRGHRDRDGQWRGDRGREDRWRGDRGRDDGARSYDPATGWNAQTGNRGAQASRDDRGGAYFTPGGRNDPERPAPSAVGQGR
jgi:hypothetical protein